MSSGTCRVAGGLPVAFLRGDGGGCGLRRGFGRRRRGSTSAPTTKATEAARAPAAPVRTAASRFFPAPRESSRDRRDVRSPKALPRLAGTVACPLRASAWDAGARPRRPVEMRAACSRRREARQAAWKACGSPAVRLDRSGAVSLVGHLFSLTSVSGSGVRARFGIARRRWAASLKDSGRVRHEVPAGRANAADRRADGHEPRHLPRRPARSSTVAIDHCLGRSGSSRGGAEI